MRIQSGTQVACHVYVLDAELCYSVVSESYSCWWTTSMAAAEVGITTRNGTACHWYRVTVHVLHAYAARPKEHDTPKREPALERARCEVILY
jgi:hypothetical protein